MGNFIVEKKKLSITKQIIITVFAISLAVALPQILHAIGRLTGTGMALGTALLPMHLPIIFVGFIAGPFVGAISGICSPIISYLLSGMPIINILPLMVIELCAYGLIAGLLSRISLPTILKVLCVQLAGRIVYVVAMLIINIAIKGGSVNLLAVLDSFYAGLAGILLQLIIIPVGVKCFKRL